MLKLTAAFSLAYEVEFDFDIGIMNFFRWDSATDLEICGDIAATVDQLVAVVPAAGKPCRHSSTKRLLARIRNQRQRAPQELDVFILASVPVALGERSTRCETRQVDTKLCEPKRIA